MGVDVEECVLGVCLGDDVNYRRSGVSKNGVRAVNGDDVQCRMSGVLEENVGFECGSSVDEGFGGEVVV